MTRTARTLVWLPPALALALVGCPETITLDDDGGLDAAAPGDDAGVDGGPSGGSDAGAGPIGDLGAPCASSADCRSGICFPAGFGESVCTEACTPPGECPSGWDCGDFGGSSVCRCEKGAESCNGEDDDCDGVVDEGRPATIGCGEGEVCADGSCGCPDARMCGERCVDILSDPNHCGSCGNACAVGGVCLTGSCCAPTDETCNGADDDCDGAVDEGRGADIGCAPLEACVSGACDCPSRCGERCVDLDRDPDHCGACGNACATELDCVTGICCEAAGTRVDVLFMVDNSNSMTEEQAALAAQLPRMVRVLATGDLDGDEVPESEPVRDLHLGVITADMGTGGNRVPTCPNSDFGDDGILRTVGRTDLSGCAASYPAFLEFRPADGGDPDAAARDFACVATVGTGGCGYEQPLEAVLKAVTPSTSPIRFFRDTTGHADGANAGFLRSDSLLVALLLTDENDCSAADPDLFNPSSSAYGSTELNLRCWRHPEALHPLTRYSDGLLAARRDPRDLIFAAIVGVPTDLVDGPRLDYARILGDSRMVERRDPIQPTSLQPTCNEPGTGLAFPGRRLIRLAQELEDGGATSVVGSICQDSYDGPVTQILGRVVERLGESCASL